MRSVKNKLKCGLLFACLTLALEKANGQTGRTMPRPLQIGDTVPDVTLLNLHNYPSRTVKLSDLRGKLVILDFWATWCGACVAAFPKMHSIQKEFGDKVQILLVNAASTRDDEKKVNALFVKRKAQTGLGVELPYVLQDSAVSPYFPYKYVPHYVWINGSGKVIAITSSTDATSENVRAALQGDVSALHTKQDLFDFDPEQPLFIDGNGGNGREFIYRSVFTPYTEGIGSSMGMSSDKNGNIYRYYLFNQSLIQMMRIAYMKVLNISTNLWRYECDSLERVRSLINESNPYHNYCYEINTPPTKENTIIEYLQTDIKRSFGVSVHSAARIIKCYVLSATSTVSKSYTRHLVSNVQIGPDIPNKVAHNVSVDFAVSMLNNYLDIPLVNETSLTQNIDLQLPNNIRDQQGIIQALQNAGFAIKEEERQFQVAVITDRI